MAAMTINVCTVRRRLPTTTAQHPRHPQDVHQDHRPSHSRFQALARLRCIAPMRPLADRSQQTERNDIYAKYVPHLAYAFDEFFAFFFKLKRLDTNFAMASSPAQIASRQGRRQPCCAATSLGTLGTQRAAMPLGKMKAGKTLWDHWYHMSMPTLKLCTI